MVPVQLDYAHALVRMGIPPKTAPKELVEKE